MSKDLSGWTLVVVATAVAVALAGCAPEPSSMESDEGASDVAREDTAAPQFRLASLSGDMISPQDFEGEIVVIDFWATWCGPCHLQAEILKGLHEEFGDKGVRFLAISLGEPEDVVREFIERNPYPYPVLVDPEDQLSLDLGIYVLPTIMVIDRNGTVAFLEPGVSDAETLRRVLYEAGVEHPATAAG